MFNNIIINSLLKMHKPRQASVAMRLKERRFNGVFETFLSNVTKDYVSVTKLLQRRVSHNFSNKIAYNSHKKVYQKILISTITKILKLKHKKLKNQRK